MSFVQAKPRATHDFYALIHKALRLNMTRLMTRLGAADGQDAEATGVLLADLRAQLRMSEMHLAKEDLYIHTALEARAPGAAAGLAREHEHHRRSFEELEGLIAEAEGAPQDARRAALHRLYLRFSLFVADDLAHMAEEEQLMLPILQSLFTDEELIGMEARIRAALTPEHTFLVAQAMIPAATHSERLALLGGIKANAPAEVFQGLLQGAARPNLSAGDFERLCCDLGVAA